MRQARKSLNPLWVKQGVVPGILSPQPTLRELSAPKGNQAQALQSLNSPQDLGCLSSNRPAPSPNGGTRIAQISGRPIPKINLGGGGEQRSQIQRKGQPRGCSLGCQLHYGLGVWMSEAPGRDHRTHPTATSPPPPPPQTPPPPPPPGPPPPAPPPRPPPRPQRPRPTRSQPPACTPGRLGCAQDPAPGSWAPLHRTLTSSGLNRHELGGPRGRSARSATGAAAEARGALPRP